MIARQIDAERKRLAEAVARKELSPVEAIEAAYELGVECERLDAMHRACEEYSRAKAAREESFKRSPSSRPPSRPK